jgi:sulfatase maturation enzyme AslB (radical SAM superfamily)
MDLTKYKNCRAHKQWIFISNNNKPYRPCCWFRSDITAESYEEYHDKLSKLDIEKNCEYCIKMEEQDGGDWSPRTLFESQTDNDTFVITASIDNVCNLKCITCNPVNSTQIAAELEPKNKFEESIKKQYLQITNKSFAKVDFIKQSLLANKLDNVRLEFLGGEPLLNPKVFELLDWLAIQPNAKDRINIAITSNGAVFSNKLPSYLGKFRYLGVQFSIDGTGKRFEHLRFNSVEDNMNLNIDNYYSMGVPISFNFTISWMNMLNFSDTYNWMQTKYSKLNTILITKLEQPTGYSVEVLPKKLRQDIFESELNRFNKPINNVFEKAIDVYKQHVTTGGTDDFNMPILIKGVTDLFELDIKRQADHYSIFKQEYDLLLQYMSPEQNELLTATILKYRNVL